MSVLAHQEREESKRELSQRAGSRNRGSSLRPADGEERGHEEENAFIWSTGQANAICWPQEGQRIRRGGRGKAGAKPVP